MKKILCIICCLSLFATTFCFSASAEQTEQYNLRTGEFGDSNDDGTVNLLDLILLRKYLAKFDVKMNFENTDMNGDCAVNLLDLIMLRKKLAKFNLTYGEKFAEDNLDINSSIQDLGIPLEKKYPDSGLTAKISARNPYDMVAFNNNVYISSGNYSSNEGPVRVVMLSRNDSRIRTSTDLSTEEVNKFYVYDDTLFALAVDPQVWGTGSYYTQSTTKGWISHGLLSNNIHCYDMIKHNGKYFFAGSSIYNINDTDQVSLGTVHSCNEEDVLSTHPFDTLKFDTIPFINKYGDEINIHDHTYGIPRVYELMEFKGTLYAMYYDYVEEIYVNSPIENDQYDGLECNGIYKYNDEKEQFEYCEGLTIHDQFMGRTEYFIQDDETVMTDFEWNDKYVAINDGIYLTNDLKTWEKRDIAGYEDYTVRDVQVIGDKLYLLANVKIKEGQWTNAVFETSDFENYRRILYFDTVSWVRSFAYTNGTFFFCVGAYRDEISTKRWEGSVVHETIHDAGKECGRVYKYIYYK